jgi:hypothetical protein
VGAGQKTDIDSEGCFVISNGMVCNMSSYLTERRGESELILSTDHKRIDFTSLRWSPFLRGRDVGVLMRISSSH